MQRIEIESNVGSCALKLSVIPKEDKLQEVAEHGLQKLLFHDAASKAFSAKSKLDRKSPFSSDLEKAVKAAILAKIEPYFVVESLETSEFVKLSDEDKFVRNMLKVGLTEAQAREAWKQAQTNKAASAASAKEPKTIE